MMMKILLTTFLLILLVSKVTSMDVDSMIIQTDEFRGYRGKTFKFKVRSTSFENDKVIKSNVVEVYFKNPSHVVVKFLEPRRERGRRILIDNENMWLYFPSARNAIRISPIDRLIGEASNGDVANTDYTAYTYELAGTDILENQKAIHIILRGKEKKATYKKIELWINDKNYKPIKSQHYGVSGKLLKTALYQSFKIDHQREFLFQVKLISAHTPSNYTIMEFYDYKLYNIPDSFFDK